MPVPRFSFLGVTSSLEPRAILRMAKEAWDAVKLLFSYFAKYDEYLLTMDNGDRLHVLGHTFLPGGTDTSSYPFKVTQESVAVSSGEVRIANGWVVRAKFTDSTTPKFVGKPEEVEGDTINVDNGDTVYLKAVYSKGTFSINPGANPHSLVVGVDSVSGFLLEDYYGTAAASCGFEAGNAGNDPDAFTDLTGTPATDFYWPLASVAIENGVMTITPIFTGGVILLPTYINIPENAA